ncbi:MAG: DUF973 family protein [Thermoplasmata archaeon]|nr:DUF973 family protein [Thermoplasmata archaeon]
MYGSPGAMSYVPPSASTAKTLILVGLILQLIFALVFLIGLGALALFAASVGGFAVVIAGVYVALGAIGFVWFVLVWMLCYKPVTEGRYDSAKTPTLVFAILSIVTGGILSGILYLIAYIKLGDAVREQQMPPQGYPGAPIAPSMPYAPQPMAPTMPYAPQPMAPMAPAPAPPMPGAVMCPKCGKPATFVAQYNRYYCYTDQQYV